MQIFQHTGSDAVDILARLEPDLLAALARENQQSENTSFALSCADDTGQMIAGLSASTSYGWLLIKMLWVADGARGQGIARTLMTQAHDMGRDAGCHAAWLDTSSPSAHQFYLHLGYSEFGLLANAPENPLPDHRRWFMQKSLIQQAAQTG